MNVIFKSSRSHLVAKRTVDKNARATTVYVNPDKGKVVDEKLKKLVLSKVKDKTLAKKLLKKYHNYPENLRIMVSGKWRNVKVPQYMPNPDGTTRREMIDQKHISINNETFNKLVKENGGLIYRVLKKWSFNTAIIDDLKQVALKGIFNGLNNYQTRFDPKNPPDLSAHLGNWMEWEIKAEMAKQMATRIQLPYNKQQLFYKFRKVYDKHGGNWDKIYDELKIKKKDVYPAIKEGGEDRLPKDGYVSTVKSDVLKKKVKDYDEKVKKIKDEHVKAVEKLEAQLHTSLGDQDSADHQATLDAFDTLIATETKKLEGASDSKREKVMNSISDLERKKEQYALELSPLSDSDYQNKLQILKDDYSAKLKKAKKKLDEEVGKTSIQGAYSLFKEFEEIISFKEMNTSTTYSNDGEARSLEEVVATQDDFTPDQKLELKEEYVANLTDFQEKISLLHPKIAQVLRMRLGLHELNTPYSHGLWGEPMELAELAKKLPKDFYVKREEKSLAARKRQWESEKPKWNKKVKLTAKEHKAAVDAFLKRKEKAKNKISRFLKTKAGKAATPKVKEAYRKKTYKDFNAVEKPSKFIDKKRSQSEMKREMEKWQKRKPQRTYRENTVVAEVKKDLAYAYEILRRTVDKKSIDNLIDTMRDLRKIHLSGNTPEYLERSLRKSMVVMDFFGYKEVYRPIIREIAPVENEISFLRKAWLTIQNFIK